MITENIILTINFAIIMASISLKNPYISKYILNWSN